MIVHINDLGDLHRVAEVLVKMAGEIKTIAFYGEMGAGKTTFIKAICKELGVTDTVSSPTFSIVNEYSSPNGSVYHFDFYRIKSQAEALDIGYEDYIDSGQYCLIEWPEKIPDLLPNELLTIKLEIGEMNQRTITLYSPK
jgi:tRNA threonylcarbamoyladenosine biosynthesis protein TsaE